MNVFEAVKDNVTTRQAAEMYGIRVSRNGMAVCPYLQGAVRYNILTERIDIVKPLWWSKQTATLNDTDLNYLMLYLEDKYSLTSEKKIQKAISIVADCDKYHPIRDYLNSLEWDGTERIRYALTRFLGAEDSEYTYSCGILTSPT